MTISSPSMSPSFDSTSVPPRLQFTMTTAGYIVPTVTGVLSTICSLMILNVIRMSLDKFTTTYHRIMTFMCLYDIMASASFALTTLPMPSDDTIRYAGPMLGNKVSCQIQGYFIIFGLTGGGALYICLAWYFVSKMTFQMNSMKIRNWLEPLFYLYSLIIALFLSCYNLAKDLIHTTPKNAFCLIAPQHSNCNYSMTAGFLICDIMEFDVFQTSLTMVNYYIGFNLVTIALAMVIIIWTILKKNRNIKQAMKSYLTSNHSDSSSVDNDDMIVSELRHSRVIVIQALMYIFSYLITWIFQILLISFDIDEQVKGVIVYFKVIFLPMQGFWNLIIFVYDKAYLVHQKHRDKSYWNAIKLVLFHPEEDSPGIIILPHSLTNQVEEKYECINNNKEMDANETPFVGSTNHTASETQSIDVESTLSSPEEMEIANSLMRKMYHTSSEGNRTALSILKMSSDMESDDFLGTSSEVRTTTTTTTTDSLPIQFLSSGNETGTQQDENRGFYKDEYGLRRTGTMEGRRIVKIHLNPPSGSSDSSSAAVKHNSFRANPILSCIAEEEQDSIEDCDKDEK